MWDTMRDRTELRTWQPSNRIIRLSFGITAADFLPAYSLTSLYY